MLWILAVILYACGIVMCLSAVPFAAILDGCSTLVKVVTVIATTLLWPLLVIATIVFMFGSVVVDWWDGL